MYREVEVKFCCVNPDVLRGKLVQIGAEFKGVIDQVDTYFRARAEF
jgi:adenylate cyclase class IV